MFKAVSFSDRGHHNQGSMELDMYQVDAFADRLFTGNPAAVVPLQQWLDADLMQKIAMENNLSETVFFVAEGEQYAIRWFTPEYEIDLCGHATLASAYIIKKFIRPQVSQLTFSTQKAGLLRVDIQDNMYTLNFPSRMPEPCEMPEGLLESLGITSAGPVLRSRDYFVVLPDEEAVLACAPDYAIMKKLPAIGVIVIAKGNSADVVSRCFYPGAGVPEDPVTGSAHCNIVPYWSRELGKTQLVCHQLSARGGVLNCSLQQDRVMMSGACVLFSKGVIYL